MTYTYPFRKISATATIFFLHPVKGALVAIRGQDVEAYPGAMSAPGGFQEAMWDGDEGVKHAGETNEAAAVREAAEEIKLEITEDRLHLFATSSSPGTDPRCHVVNVCYIVILTDEEADLVDPGDDIEDADWQTFDQIRSGEGNWAFDHHSLMLKAIDRAFNGVGPLL